MNTYDPCLECPSALACIVGYAQGSPRVCFTCHKLVMPLKPRVLSLLTYGAVTPFFDNVPENCPALSEYAQKLGTFQCKKCHDEQLLGEIRAARQAGETVVS